MKTYISLFDYSGNWPAYFAAAGNDVILLDIKNGFDINQFESVEDVFDIIEDCDGIIAAPPCTDFAVSGAQYWNKKDLNGTTQKSLDLVYQVMKFADLFQPTDPEFDGSFFWVFENPVGRLPKLIPEIGKAYYFDPCDFAGYLDLTDSDHNELDRLRKKDGIGITAEENDFIISCNAYTKKTGLWGCFNRNIEIKRIEPVKCAPQGSFTQRLGGKSEKTKELRSVTPLGFAKAFYQANFDWCEYDINDMSYESLFNN